MKKSHYTTLWSILFAVCVLMTLLDSILGKIAVLALPAMMLYISIHACIQKTELPWESLNNFLIIFISIFIEMLFDRYRYYSEWEGITYLIILAISLPISCINVVAFCRRKSKKRVGKSLAAIVMILYLTLIWCERTNVVFATSPAQIVIASVESKETRTPRAILNCKADLKYTDNEGSETLIWIPISYTRYKSMHQGDNVHLAYGKGCLGFCYYALCSE